jgi:adenylate cyclase
VTSAEQPDTFRTVYSTSDGVDLSGAEIGATAFANLLADRVLRPVSALGAFAVLVGFGIFVGVLTRLLPGIYAVAITAAVGSAYYGSAQFLFTQHMLLIPLAIPVLVQLPLALFVGVLSRYRDIRKQVPIEIDPNAPLEEFQGVCLATDVTGYTRVAEAMKPNELAPLLDEYYDMLRGLVARRRGLTWGRAGDSTMCVWKGSRTASRFGKMVPVWLARHGGTDADKEARLNACLAAIEMRDAIDRFNERQAATRQLQTRIGLDAGEIALGSVGGELRP